MKVDNREGKAIYYYKSGNRLKVIIEMVKWKEKEYFIINEDGRYEGDFRNDKFEGKGIDYINNGDRIMGDYYNDKPVGKHFRLTENGDVEIENC